MIPLKKVRAITQMNITDWLPITDDSYKKYIPGNIRPGTTSYNLKKKEEKTKDRAI